MNDGKLRKILKEILIFPFIILIRFYRVCISPLKPPSCRFTPTCSEYAIEAFRMHGPVKGLFLTVRRIGRCHPWGGSGYDPVPEQCTIFGTPVKALPGNADAGHNENNAEQTCQKKKR